MMILFVKIIINFKIKLNVINLKDFIIIKISISTLLVNNFRPKEIKRLFDVRAMTLFCPSSNHPRPLGTLN